MNLEPKFRRPGKPGHIWPGVFKVSDSHPDKKNRWRLACPAPLCFYQGAYPDQGTANRLQETHPCPWFGGGTTTLSWGIMSDMFLAPIWKKLDRAVDNLMLEKAKTPEELGHEYDNLHRQEGACRGLAEALAVLMPPFFHTGDEIVQEAVIRWQKRQAGEDYETPGIGRLRFKTPPGAEVLTPSGLSHVHVAGTKHSPEYHPANAVKNFGLSAEKVAEIVGQAKTGFESRILAMVHGVTENVIKQILKANGG